MGMLGASVALVGIILLYFSLRKKPKVVVIKEESLQVEAAVNSEKQAEVATKPVTKRVYKKKEISEQRVGDKEGEESK